MKKIISLILTMAMFMCFGLVGFAQTMGSITIQNDINKTGVSMIGHTYGVYKILDTTMDGEKYAYSVSEEFKRFFIDKAKEYNTDISTPAKLNKFAIEYIQVNENNMSSLTEELILYVINNEIYATKISDEAIEEKVNITDLPIGYYLILDNGNETSEKNPIAAAALGTTSNELIINLKGSAPTIDKEIKHNEDDSWGNVGDNQIGDNVEYRLKATIPSDLTGYKNYTYIIHDTLSKGLTFNEDIEVYVGDKYDGGIKLNYNYTVTSPATDNHTFDISIDILNGINEKKFKEGDELYIYYSALLNEDALIAGDSNDNKVDLEYSNNPYDENSKDKTPEVTVKDYTFKINALKTMEDGETALQGAEFELSKDRNSIYFNLNQLDATNKYIVCEETHAHGAQESTCTKTIVSPQNGKFEIIGLDDEVEYILTETKAPEGYNPIDPIKFIIMATYDDNGEITNIETNVNGITKEDNTFELKTTIVNTTGNKLPETGGMGTTIFLAIGSILMMGSMILLIFRYRSN